MELLTDPAPSQEGAPDRPDVVLTVPAEWARQTYAAGAQAFADALAAGSIQAAAQHTWGDARRPQSRGPGPMMADLHVRSAETIRRRAQRAADLLAPCVGTVALPSAEVHALQRLASGAALADYVDPDGRAARWRKENGYPTS